MSGLEKLDFLLNLVKKFKKFKKCTKNFKI